MYFSFICDATPDASKMEQNVLILRYVFFSEDENEWNIQERFLEYFNFHKKTGDKIAAAIIEVFNKHGINMEQCRGQCFDNGSNMAGHIKGVQAKIKERNPAAIFSPCAAHNLNLVGLHAAKSRNVVSTFFNCVNMLYNFFSGSPQRWEVLLQHTGGRSLHGLSETRWSARIEAVKPITEKLPAVLKALHCIKTECNLTSDGAAEANGLIDYFSKYETIILLNAWKDILNYINERSLILQSTNMSLDIEMKNIEALKKIIDKDVRLQWNEYLKKAKETASEIGVVAEFEKKRGRKRKVFFDDSDSANEASQIISEETDEEKFKKLIFDVMIEKIVSQLERRYQEVKNICTTFEAILKINTVSDDSETTMRLIANYPDDLSDNLLKEITMFKSVFTATFPDLVKTPEQKGLPLLLLNKIYNLKLQTVFPELCIALRIFVTLPVTVASGERGFSKLSLIKNHLRSTLGQDKLNHLAMLSIEHKLASKMSFVEVINEFVSTKSRRFSIPSSVLQKFSDH